MKDRKVILIGAALALVGVALLVSRNANRETLHEEVTRQLREQESLEEVSGVLLEAAKRGEIGLLAYGGVKQVIQKVVPWDYPHMLVESNRNVIGVFVFIGPRYPTGFCVFEGDPKRLETGVSRSFVSSNVFVFEFPPP